MVRLKPDTTDTLQLPQQPPSIPHRGGSRERRHEKQEDEHDWPREEFGDARVRMVVVEPDQIDRENDHVQRGLNPDRLEPPLAAQDRYFNERRGGRRDWLPRAPAE